MIKDLWLVGIGTGSLGHLTLDGQAALRDAAVILVPRKGDGKTDLVDIRLNLIKASGSTADVRYFDYPERDAALPYQARVALWHDDIADRWQAALADCDGPVALLVWGDPSLYDSTLRIAERLSPKPALRVLPGITAIQALTAAHAIPLNTVNGPVHVTTGRRLRDLGWPEGAESVVVMLDGRSEFQSLKGRGLFIWWGAYLGAREEILMSGPLDLIADDILKRRENARARHGWIMDTYLLRPATAD